MKKLLGLLLVCVILFSNSEAFAWSDMNVQGEFDGWSGQAASLENGIWRVTIQATRDDSSSEFKFYSSNDGGTWWGNASSLETLPTATDLNTTAGNSSFDEDSGQYYTFTAIDASSLTVALQETSTDPVSISSFSSEVSNGGSFDRVKYGDDASQIANNVNTVTASLSGTPSEDVFVFYTTDGNFDPNSAQSDIVSASSGSGSSRSGDIAAQAGGTTVNYYVLTSTFSEGNMDSVENEIDVLLRALDEDKGNTLSYSVYDTGNAFHIQTQTAGAAGEEMLTGGSGVSQQDFLGTETEARIYSGNVFQNATVSKDQGAYILHYSIDGGSWVTQNDDDFDNTTVNDKYWLNTLDLTGVSSGSVIRYYLESQYTDADTTYIYDGGGSYITGNETLAQDDPFEIKYGDQGPPGSTIPEPGTLAVSVLGLGMIMLYRKVRANG